VSCFRSHFGQTGRGTAQILPIGPGVKNVVSRCIMIDPHLAHWAGGGSVDRRLNTPSILEWRLWDISLRYSPGQNGDDQYCSLLRTEGLALAPLFSRRRTSAKMPVQATLLPVSCAPPPRDKFEQRGQPSCDAVPSISVAGPKSDEPAFGGARLTPCRPGAG
jgi:hypothetical protein